MEETVLEGAEKQNEVSLSESVDQVHEASASEVPEDEEKHANEASKSRDSNISEHTCTEGELNTEATNSAKEIPAGSQEEILWQPIKDESMIKIPEAEVRIIAILYFLLLYYLFYISEMIHHLTIRTSSFKLIIYS